MISDSGLDKHRCPRCKRLNYKRGAVSVLAAFDSIPLTEEVAVALTFEDLTSYWVDVA
jgi:hypothetical protein